MKIFWGILPLFVLIAIFMAFSYEKSFQVFPAQISDMGNKINQEKKEEKINIILVGDIMLDRGVEYMIDKEGNGDFKFPFLKIADYLRSADIVFGNLEGPISDKGRKVGSIYSFRHNPKAIDGLIYAGFNVLSFANNHAFDYTLEALEDNFTRLKAAGIDYVGAGFNQDEAHSAVIKEIKGVKIGFLEYTNLGAESWAATEERGGIARISGDDLEILKQDIMKAKNETDVLIVSIHAGEEYTQNLTGFQKEFSKAAIDAGADLVVGHHPHISQTSEQYNGKWIFYSLGNFIFDQGFSEETMKGAILEILIENGKIKEIIPREIKMNEFFQPELVE